MARRISHHHFLDGCTRFLFNLCFQCAVFKGIPTLLVHINRALCIHTEHVKRFNFMDVKNEWENESSFEILEEEWRSYCDFQLRCTNLHTWRIFKWKFLIRFIVTPKQNHSFASGQTCTKHWNTFTVLHYFRESWTGYFLTPPQLQLMKSTHNGKKKLFYFTYK